MAHLSESNQNLIGKWRIVNWDKQHLFYQPNQDPFENIGDWTTLNTSKLEDCPSNLIYSGISEQNIDKISSKEVLFEFTDKAKDGYLDFNIFINTEIVKSVYWESSNEPEYSDLTILIGEVYNYAQCKINKLTKNELILIERIDNTVSDIYFNKISFVKIDERNRTSKSNKSWLFKR